jgi:serine/threonine-protein kinase
VAREIGDKELIETQMHALVGQQINAYKIVAPLGKGGMGEVYLAYDTRLGRKVALKLLPAEFTRDRERVRRFTQEARAASALNHPNIITIHEIGQDGQSQYIVTEYVEGETLRARLNRAPQERLDPSEAVELTIQVATALAAAHEAGIIHRDIKPENVMVRRDGIVKVLDFGLAKLAEVQISAPMEDVPTLVTTQSGVLLGTVSYMSPEQARGQEMDARTDLFSLGSVLYEMVAGSPPFRGATATDILLAVCDKEPQSPGQVSAELQQIIGQALRKERAERYQTSRALLADLKRWQQAQLLDGARLASAAAIVSDTSHEPSFTAVQTPSGASPTAAVSNAEYVVTGIKRHRVAAITALIGIAVAAFALTYYWHSLRGPKSGVAIESIAVLPFANESGSPDAEYLSDGMTETLINSLCQLPGVNVKARSSVFHYKGKDVSPQTVAKELGVQAVLNGRVIQHGSDLTLYLSLVNAATENQLWGKQYNQKMTDLVTLQTQIAQDVSENLKAKLTRAEEQKVTKSYTANPDAYRLYLQGRYFWNKRTERDLRKSVEYFGQALSLDPNYALAYSGIADANSALGLGFNFAPSLPETVFPKAKQAALRALEIDNKLAEAHVSLGLIKERWDWDFAGAESEYKRAIELDPNYAQGPHRYGVFLTAMGRLDQGIAQLERARTLDPLSTIIASMQAWPYTRLRRYDRAIEILRNVLEMDPNFIRARSQLAVNYAQIGRYEEAITEEKKAFELTGGPVREDGTRRIDDWLVIIYAQAGRKTEALKMVAEVDELEKQGRYLYHFTRAGVYAELGDKEQAFKWLEKAYGARSPAMVDLKGAPSLDKIRDDPRFNDLVRRVGLPQ